MKNICPEHYRVKELCERNFSVYPLMSLKYLPDRRLEFDGKIDDFIGIAKNLGIKLMYVAIQSFEHENKRIITETTLCFIYKGFLHVYTGSVTEAPSTNILKSNKEEKIDVEKINITPTEDEDYSSYEF